MSPSISDLPALPPTGSVVVLSGAGLSAASGVPTFRGAGGWWRGREAMSLATPEAFEDDPDLVLDFYAERRKGLLGIQPNPGHAALVSLQASLGAERVVLVTQNVDGLLQAAAAARDLPLSLTEMHGSIWTVRCVEDERHPRIPVERDAPDPRGVCARCGARLRPDVVWFGEMPRQMQRIHQALARCSVFLSVGTSGQVYPAAGFVDLARQAGARCIEVNPEPTSPRFHQALAAGAEVALPALVAAWTAPRSA